ncbi:MAG TPA: SDR family NAD(P)-dependent oxidoreductase [Phycisphaerae bacterium]|nr:SDR family NAD(P)-dependent oxidoreductase [Phycisphaerae bacterium]
MTGKLHGKTAIVTGSSSGIGKAVALRFAAEGAAVCVVANHNADGGRATAAEIERAGGRAAFVQADVSLAADCKRIADEARAALGPVDVLVNNAGITRSRGLQEMDEAFWHHVLDTNLTSAFLLAREVVGDMLARGSGSVMNVSSVHAAATHGGFGAYAASKAGLCGLTRALALEFGSRGVRFNCVLPGTIDITLYPRPGKPEPDRDTWRPRESDIQVMKRCGSPEEVAAAICFLASDEASYVNGAAWAVDGGLLGILKDRP